MKNYILFNVICWLSVGVAAAAGLSEGAGLFGALLAGGTFILYLMGNKT